MFVFDPRPGDRIQVLDDSNEDWWKVRAVLSFFNIKN